MVKKAAATEPAKLTAIRVTKDAEKGNNKGRVPASRSPAVPAVARKSPVNRRAKPKKESPPSMLAEPLTVSVMGSDSLKVYVETSRIFAEGFADLSKELAGYAQRGFDSQIAMTREMAGAKSMEELLKLQAKATCERLESAIEESAKLTDLSISMTNRAMEPIRSQFDRQVEIFWKPLAA